MMIDIGGAIPGTLSRLKKLPTGKSLELLTYKRDRSIRITKDTDATFTVIESGFQHNTFTADLKGLKKLLKTLLKREFPRSNKVRLQELD